MFSFTQASTVRAAALVAAVALFAASHTAMAAKPKEISYWADATSAQIASQAGDRYEGSAAQVASQAGDRYEGSAANQYASQAGDRYEGSAANQQYAFRAADQGHGQFA